ncbi:MAG: ATP-binding protein [Pseudomonadota bacterium]
MVSGWKLGSIPISARIALTSVAFAAIAFVALIQLRGWHERSNLLEQYARQMAEGAGHNAELLREGIDALHRDALFLSQAPATEEFASGLAAARPAHELSTLHQRAIRLFSAFARNHPRYFQLRIIGLADQGREILRIEPRGDAPYVVPAGQLQRKGGRDYVQAGLRLRRGEVHLSEITLNQEHGRLSLPHTPTLRAVTPLFDAQGRRIALVVINMDMRPLLASLARQSLPEVDVRLANQAGDYLLHPDPSLSFGFDLGKRYGWRNDLPALRFEDQDTDDAQPNLQALQTPAGTMHAVALRIHYDPLRPNRHLGLIHTLPDSVIQREIDKMRDTSLGTLLLASFLALALLLTVLRRIFVPLDQLRHAAIQIGEGRYDAAIPEVRGDELRDFAQAFEVMQARVAEREAQLQANQATLRATQEMVGIGNWCWDLRNDTLNWSETTYRVFGRDPALPPAPYPELKAYFTEESWSRLDLAFSRCLAEGVAYQCDVELVRGDGAHRWVTACGDAMRDAEGHIVELRGTVQDITERKDVALRLQQDGERQSVLRRMLETALQGMPLQATLDASLRLLLEISWLASQGKGGIFLMQPKGDQLRLAVSHGLSAEIEAGCGELPLGRCLCGQAAATGQLLHADHIDERHQIQPPGMRDHGHYSVPLSSRGRVLGVMVVVLPEGHERQPEQEEFLKSAADILATCIQRDHAEGELRKLSLAVEQNPNVIMITNRDVEIEYVNQAFQEVSGYAREEVAGKNPRLLQSGQTPRATYREMWQALEQGRTWRGEVVNRRKSGEIYYVNQIVSPIQQPDGSISHYVSISEDISAQKRIEWELELHRHHLEEVVAIRTAELEAARLEAEQLARVKSQFLANMSHEIRTPMNAVLGMARIGLRNCGDAKAREAFSHIVNAGEHLLGVVNDILDFSKLVSGKLKLVTQPYALMKPVQDTMRLIEERARAKGLRARLEVGEGVPRWVAGDPLRLEQILLNLLSNAVKFTDKGEVTLSVTREGGDTLFRVSDNGIGMSQEQVARLFNAFEQGDTTPTRQFGGTGLGLTISLDLAHMMGGDIDVQSSLGEGSVFTLRLPLAETTSPEEQPQERQGDAPRLSGVRVLAAEDVELNRIILADMLEQEGARVVFAENGREALDNLDALGAAAFDVVLMDVQMPVMDGHEAARRIAAVAPELPIIALTAHVQAEDREKCLAAGMAEHVTKPIEGEQLVAAILRHLRNRAAPATAEAEPPAAASAPAAPAAEAAPRADAPTRGMIDWEVLSARFSGRQGFIDRLLGKVIDSQAESAEKLRAAVRLGDIEAIVFIAHSLKGLGGNIEAGELRALASQVEQHHRAGVTAPLADEVEALSVLVERLLREVREHLERSAQAASDLPA